MYSIKFKNGNLRVFLERKKKSARGTPRENHRFRIIIDNNTESVVFTRDLARASFFLSRHTLRIPFLREGPRLKGGYSGGSGSGVPPYDFLNLYGVSDCRF